MRGRLASLQQMAMVLGLFSAFLSNAILARVAGGASEVFWFGAPTWRWMFHFWRHELDGEFHCHRHFFTVAGGGRSDGRLRFLRDSRSDLAPLCMAHRVRDKRQNIGTETTELEPRTAQ